MKIIESTSDKQNFLELWNTKSCSIVPIWCDLEKHPMDNKLSFLYISFGGESFIVSFDHTDCLPTVDIDLSQSTTHKWIWNKKGFLQTGIEIQNLNDVQSTLFFDKAHLYDFNSKIEVLTNFYNRLGLRDELGKSIPIMKWGEVLEDITNQWSTLLPHTPTKNWVDSDVIPVLSKVEEFGIHIDESKFSLKWQNHSKFISNDKVYTEYNPYTVTSRPSNHHGGVNFSALNKKDGSRDSFVPSKGNVFVQMDYDAYHPRIIGKIINYELPKTSVHQWLADQYGCSYDEGKGITFQLLYGGIPEEFDSIPFYKKVREYISKLWVEVKQKGYVSTLNRKIPLSQIEEPNAQKVFNYLIQATETEFNIQVLKKLIDKNHTPILYTYDSFLFDIPADRDLVLEIKEITESLGFPVNMTTGTRYSKL